MKRILSVGIVALPCLSFNLKKEYSFDGKIWRGPQKACIREGKIDFGGKLHDEVVFRRSCDDASFVLDDVTIGIGFHWNRNESQIFPEDLKLIVEGDSVRAINLVDIETYLVSVISSEMSATCSESLLRAHCIISRSWLLAQVTKNRRIKDSSAAYSACFETDTQRIKWYDREDHTSFDVCADDHCQRYHGLSRASTGKVRNAVRQTEGQVLVYDGEICDARFSKCCGGALEEFGYCWEPKNFAYLVKRRDSDSQDGFPDLRCEENARRWILSSPEAFCNTSDSRILSQVLNNFDRETRNFYRWKVEYTVEELSELVKERSGVDFGEIEDIVPLARGTSGRLWKLKIVGSKRTMVIGKELEIRKTFSRTHLYSSAFVVDRENDRFIFHGAGWGHGVGLCQIGAAVMGEKGYAHQDILSHYFPGSVIEKKY